MRGMWIAPHCEPAHTCETRTQVVMSSLRFSSSSGSSLRSPPSRSQKKRTRTRACSSVTISLESGCVFLSPTTIAVCGPWTIGRGVWRAGRNGLVESISRNAPWKTSASLVVPEESISGLRSS